MFFFSPEDRGVCYASDVTHTRLAWFRSFLIVAAQDKYERMATASRPPPPVRRGLTCIWGPQTPAHTNVRRSGRTSLSIYDLKNKFVAFAMPVQPPQ